ncbi:hypothetical protein, partial [Sphingobium cupriresistens]|uniref:hypothetical protein n=1 Tax=Sphingobium cupriresistens TaxID=1132417 RepID=UPI001A912832
AILSSVIVFFSRFEFASEPYQKIDGGHPLRETFLHHPVGHDREPHLPADRAGIFFQKIASLRQPASYLPCRKSLT